MNDTGFAQPMTAGSYSITSGFGMRDGAMHKGLDMAAPVGTPILAAASGTVAAAGSASGFGQWIVLDHIIDGKKWSTVYGHMYPDGVLVRTGAIVTKGQHIANVGSNGVSTGAHLHFEVWDGGRLTGGHAVDPAAQSLGTNTVALTSDSAPPNPLNPFGGSTDVLSAVWDFVSFVIDPHNWWRVFLFLCGAAAVIYVLWSMMNGGV